MGKCLGLGGVSGLWGNTWPMEVYLCHCMGKYLGHWVVIGPLGSIRAIWEYLGHVGVSGPCGSIRAMGEYIGLVEISRPWGSIWAIREYLGHHRVPAPLDSYPGNDLPGGISS